MGSYIPNTTTEREAMLRVCGYNTIDELFAQIPEKVRLQKLLSIPAGLSEKEVRSTMEKISQKNKIFDTCFRGAGAYKHYIPAVVKQIPSKEEFLTAYTPYQAEISQGILQSIFEYQTMICELTGMDVSNASVYDGAEAAAEAVAMCKERARNKTLISATVNPQIISVVQTYCYAAGTPCVIIPEKNGQTDCDALQKELTADVACVISQTPNFYGIIEDLTKISEIAHNAGAKSIASCNPIALATLKTPRECNADIAVGDGQPLGMSLAFGGPYLGFMATTTAMMRKLPGRIVGQTKDADGKRAFVLTLQAREQHIRREKASSNICSNQALCALTAAVYLSAMGPNGIKEVSEQCLSKANYFANELSKIGFAKKHTGVNFHEFVTTSSISSKKVLQTLEKENILGGLPLSESEILWCVTEENSKADMDKVIGILKQL